MNSNNINYNSISDIKKYMNYMINDLNKFNETILGNDVKIIDVKIITDNLIKEFSSDLSDFKYIFKTFDILKLYISCIDIPKFVKTSLLWNIKSINFNLKEFLRSQLNERAKHLGKDRINRIIDIYFNDILLNINYALINFKSILLRLRKIYKSDSKFKIENSKYKVSEDTRVKELQNTFKLIMNDTFYVFRKLMRSSTDHLNKIDETYEDLLIKFIINHLPCQYYLDIIDTFECIDLYLKCIDLNKFIEYTDKFNMISIEFNAYNTFLNLINTQFGGMANDQKAFIKSILNKLNPIFDCINYILLHPKNILNNAKIFISYDDDIF